MKPKLDPVTLRWLADEEETNANRFKCVLKTTPLPYDSAKGYREMEYQSRRNAKRLRNLATRAERSPGGKGGSR